MTSTAQNPPQVGRDVMWTLISFAAPSVIGLVTIPFIVRGLGTERFAVLTLAWALIGYFSILDLGIGRALTHYVAKHYESARVDAVIGRVARDGLLVAAALGAIAAILLGVLATTVSGLLQVPIHLHRETNHAILVLAVALPATTVSAAFRGILEGLREFRSVNWTRIWLGSSTFLAPLAALYVTTDLGWAITAMCVSRFAGVVLYGCACIRAMPSLAQATKRGNHELKPLLSFGGWTTLSNVISPILTTSDRFVIGSRISLAAVAFYTTPYELVSRLLIVPAAVVAVVFPTLTSSLKADPSRASSLYVRSMRSVIVLLLPVVLLFAGLAPEVLRAWLGDEFARNSAGVLRYLALGVLFNGIGYVPLVLLQSAARPDIAAKSHLVQLLLYILALWLVLPRAGIAGAAFLWMARMVADTLFLLLVAHRVSRSLSAKASMTVYVPLAVMVLVTAALSLAPVTIRAACLGAMLIGWPVVAWVYVLDPEDRLRLKTIVRLAPA